MVLLASHDRAQAQLSVRPRIRDRRIDPSSLLRRQEPFRDRRAVGPCIEDHVRPDGKRPRDTDREVQGLLCFLPYGGQSARLRRRQRANAQRLQLLAVDRRQRLPQGLEIVQRRHGQSREVVVAA
jgi:hypothetical protein